MSIKPTSDNVFLMLITDYKVPKRLKEIAEQTAASLPAALRNIALMPSGMVLDAKMLNRLFVMDKWNRTSIPVSALRKHMPRGVLSPNADRVATWARIERAMERPVAYVAAHEEKAFFLMPSAENGTYLVTIDFKEKKWACSSPEYTGKSPERFALDKHIISALTYYRNEILDRAASPAERRAWRDSYTKCSGDRTMEANWVYYFIKEFVPRIGFEAAQYDGATDIPAAMDCLMNSQNVAHEQ